MASSQEYASYFPINFHQARLLLIAADDSQNRADINAALQQCLPEVKLVVVEDLGQAYLLLADWQNNQQPLPKLILLDLFQNQNPSRKQWIKELKEGTAPYRNIPVIVISDSADQADVREAYEMGCSAYMLKSCDGPSWFQILESIRRYWWDVVILPLS
ncbi:response regulator [Telluribacter humicola]|uniref:hypothetical protein n=1 Tax=Telluribacter humicola TaxID=1720261 RepID=UPI001A95B043|nr:hypothetical protein [Telluribacter humicola]